MAVSGSRVGQSMPRFTPYTSSDDSDDGHVVVRKKTKPRRKTQTAPKPKATTVAPMDLGKDVVLTTQPITSDTSSTNKVPAKGRLKRYFSRHFSELKKEFNGPLTTSLSSTTLDNVEELRTVQSSTIASATAPPQGAVGSQPHKAAPTSMRHSKSVGDLHLHLPALTTKEEQGSAGRLAGENQSGQTLLGASVDPSKKPKQNASQASFPDAQCPMIQMGDKGPSAARDMTSLGFSAQPSPSRVSTKKVSSSAPSSAAPPLNSPNKSPKSTMQRLEEKFASWFSSKKTAKAASARKGASVDKKKIIPTKSSSSSVSSALLLDSSSSNENPKKPKKKRVDFVLVHKQVESLFHDKKPAPLKSGSWSFARLRENMSTSEVTPAPESGADRSLSAALSGATGPGAPQLPPLSLGNNNTPSINTNNNSTNNINNLHKATTSITSDPATLFPESDMTSEDEEAHWNDGYRLWKERRAAWLTPHPEYLQELKEKEEGGEHAGEAENSDTARFEDIPEEGYPMVYERLVDKTKTLKKPLNLAFVLKVMKAGWVATGQWPSS
ncbi:hypothetical protein CKK34_1938 [Yarrowia sp. E02]|nr:hypothetical protein CKK34_1938 [Yarrowia sp. E02]